MNLQEQINEQYLIISKAKATIAKLKLSCTHQSSTVMWCSDCPGSMYPIKVCDLCGNSVGQPTQKEINEFMAEEKALQEKFLVETYGEEKGREMLKSFQIKDHWSKPLEWSRNES